MVALPLNKLSWVLALLNHWISPGVSFSSCKAASLHGKLVHLSCIFPLIHPFLWSIAVFPSSFRSLYAKLQVPPPLAADLSWVHFLVQNLLNQMPLPLPQVVNLQWWGDASTSFSIGIVVVNLWVIWKWLLGFHVGPRLNFNIGWAEAVVIELGLCMAIHLGLFLCSDPSQAILLVHSNNFGVVVVTNKGCSCGKETNITLKHVFLLQAHHHVQLRAAHVAGHDNISGTLSRGDIPGFLQGFPSAYSCLTLPLPSHLSDKLVQG